MQHFPLNADEKELTFQIISDNLKVKTHLALLKWLQGDIQKLLPHEILISAWGDFSLGLIYLDIVALHPLLRTVNISKEKLRPEILELFSLWQAHQNQPLQIKIEDGYLNISKSIKKNIINNLTQIETINVMNAAVVHGIKDSRGSDDCLYILLSEKSAPKTAKNMLPVFMPFIDCALRRIEQLPENSDHENPAELANDQTQINAKLSPRECGIMDLVKEGKTNDEIANVLDISVFTVKNHLQKVFRKLDAINRSQAAFKYKSKTKK